MSVSRALNAVIAMLEDRPQLFKELLRAPESDVKNLTQVESRLRAACNRYAAIQIRAGLMKACSITPASSPEGSSDFFAGVRSTEAIFEEMVTQLEQA